LYAYLGRGDVVALIAGRAVGATMPNLNTSILRGIPVEYPSYDKQARFATIVEPIDDLIENLIAKNCNLRATRDLLLPRLISGEIDVSSLPLPPTP
jgi:type I restriction enzyme S subunit